MKAGCGRRIAVVALGGLWWAACHRPLSIGPPMLSYPAQRLKADVGETQSLAQSPTAALAPRAIQSDPLDEAAVDRLAVVNNPAVIAARARLKKAAARLESAAAWPNPELDGRVVLDRDGALLGEAAFRFALPLGGRVGAAQEVAAVEYDLARVELRAARRRAQLEAERALARIAWSRARLGLLEKLAERSARYAELARSRRDASVADPIDVALVLADAMADRRALERGKAEVARLEQELRSLVGLAPQRGVFAPGELCRLRLAEPPAALEKAAIESNPSVLRAKLGVLVADGQAARIAAERVGDLLIGPALVAEPGATAVGLSASIPIPLLQSGRGAYEEALAERRVALEAYHQALRTAVADVLKQLSRLRSIRAELQALLAEPGAALQQALRLAEVRYEVGKLDVLRLLSVHRAYARWKLQALELLLRQRETMIDLAAVVGRAVERQEVQP